jgi:hypothetical protein
VESIVLANTAIDRLWILFISPPYLLFIRSHMLGHFAGVDARFLSVEFFSDFLRRNRATAEVRLSAPFNLHNIALH